MFGSARAVALGSSAVNYFRSISTYVTTLPERYRRTVAFRPFNVIQGHFLYQSKARMRLPVVRQSNLGPIFHRFGDSAGFFVLRGDPTPIPP